MGAGCGVGMKPSGVELRSATSSPHRNRSLISETQNLPTGTIRGEKAARAQAPMMVREAIRITPNLSLDTGFARVECMRFRKVGRSVILRYRDSVN